MADGESRVTLIKSRKSNVTGGSRSSIFLWLLLFVCAVSPAQDRRQGAYLIPQTVYVGDRATLALPLPDRGAGAEISLDPKELPVSPDIELHRVTLERRPSGSRLLIEFSAYTPGLLELPPIEIDGERFAGLRVEISSILGPGDSGSVLSGIAAPLAIPGTSLLVYGTMGALAVILLLLLWAALWGRRRLEGWILNWKRRRLIVSMAGIEKRLRRALHKDGDRRGILNTLSGEFRGFLSFFTGENCRAMTALELGSLVIDGAKPADADIPGTAAESAGDDGAFLSGEFLGGFFSRCDGLRFSGRGITEDETLAMLGDLRRFLVALDRAGRGMSRQSEAA